MLNDLPKVMHFIKDGIRNPTQAYLTQSPLSISSRYLQIDLRGASESETELLRRYSILFSCLLNTFLSSSLKKCQAHGRDIVNAAHLLPDSLAPSLPIPPLSFHLPPHKHLHSFAPPPCQDP